MTKAQFTKKVNELIRRNEKYLKEECQRLFGSGGVDTSSFENDYALPKIVLHTALKNSAWQWHPFTYKQEASNLEHF